MSEKNLTDREFVEKYESIANVEDSDIVWYFFIIVGICVGLAKICSSFHMNSNYVLLISFVLVILGVCFVVLYIEKNKNRKFLETLGMTQEKAKRYYDTIINNVIGFRIMPLVRQVCMLNPEAKESQTQMMEGWYGMSRSSIKYVYEERCGNAENLRLAYKYLLKESLSYRKFFVEKLFKLAIVDDGIHNDEWNLLIDIMKQLKFNKNYFDFFIKRYGPLRTEFEDDESGENTSTKSIPVSQLKAYFAILGLEEGASDVEIKKAYHNLALQHHPDLPKNANRVSECEELMARINEAYEKIRN